MDHGPSVVELELMMTTFGPVILALSDVDIGTVYASASHWDHIFYLEKFTTKAHFIYCHETN